MTQQPERCINCDLNLGGNYSPYEGIDGLCPRCFPASPLQRAVIHACIELGDVDATAVDIEMADDVIQRLQDVGIKLVSIEAADTAASEARQEFKALEQSYMVLQDQYSELARAIGVEGDAFWGDPLESHDQVLAKAKILKDTLKVFLEARL